MTPVVKFLRKALVALAVLGFAACEADRGPTSPAGDAPAFQEINGVKLVSVKPGRMLVPGETVLVSVKTGATIASGDATLVVVAGSVPNGTKITMEPQNNGYVEFKFGPNGLQFSTPATLTISAAKANLGLTSKSRLKVARASDDLNDWKIIGGTYDPVTDSVTVSISGFSRYALCVE